MSVTNIDWVLRGDDPDHVDAIARRAERLTGISRDCYGHNRLSQPRVCA